MSGNFYIPKQSIDILYLVSLRVNFVAIIEKEERNKKLMVKQIKLFKNQAFSSFCSLSYLI